MPTDETQAHSSDALQSSPGDAAPNAPPCVPGYDTRQFLGKGAFGQVWVAVDKTTGRQVAIKFFSHRKALDWSSLSREVEKLVFLSTDRYVVQLLDVGWDAEPPYYVMEYIENGSLEDHLRQHGTLPIAVAAELFREVAIGLSHAHSKGVLHCDLKPANVLLDQDLRPRLADFGQSRLTHEQSPALGTLFYMAPEQADLKAVPDARWDVYALGALVYCMLTGAPPHRTPTSLTEFEQMSGLTDRLAHYKRLIRNAPPPEDHRKIPGIDRALVEIIDRCLSAEPGGRYPHVANVLQALEARRRARTRRPLWLLGFVAPLILLATMGLFGYRGYRLAVDESQELARRGAENSSGFAVEGEAKVAANEIERRIRAVEAAAEDQGLLQQLVELQQNSELQETLEQLADPQLDESERQMARRRFVASSDHQRLQDYLDILIVDQRQPRVASWILTGPRGNMLAAAFADEPANTPVADCFAYRTYYHGGPRDLDKRDRTQRPVTETHISAKFRSTATGTSKVAVTTPVMAGAQVLGVVGITVELGAFVSFPTSQDRCALLVDGREGDFQGVVLQHPLYEELISQQQMLPERFDEYRMDIRQWTTRRSEDRDRYRAVVYQDPLGQDVLGHRYRGDWIGCAAPVQVTLFRDEDGTITPGLFDTGFLMVVQERLATASEPVQRLASRLLLEGLAALLAIAIAIPIVWGFVMKMMRDPEESLAGRIANSAESSTVHSRETLEAPFADRR